ADHSYRRHRGLYRRSCGSRLPQIDSAVQARIMKGEGSPYRTWEGRRCPMQVYRKSAELARKFDAAYPEELSARMQWWSKALGIDRRRLLRMIGMSAAEARGRKRENLKKILTNPQWEANALLVEGGLHRLLALFHYDWHILADRIHAPVASAEQGETA